MGLDDEWQACHTGWNRTFHAADGTPLINTETFPDIAQLPAKAHSLGLKAGWCESALSV